MPIVVLLALIAAGCGASPSRPGDAFGVWGMNAARSTLMRGPYPKSLTIRFEPHPKGEVFTLDRIDEDGRITTSSTILYFDGEPHDFQDVDCRGSQSSRRVDSRTVEILRSCASGEWTRFVRRLSAQPKELILEIAGQHPGEPRFERRLTLEKR
jgi:hypothetical protein